MNFKKLLAPARSAFVRKYEFIRFNLACFCLIVWGWQVGKAIFSDPGQIHLARPIEDFAILGGMFILVASYRALQKFSEGAPRWYKTYWLLVLLILWPWFAFEVIWDHWKKRKESEEK